MFTFEKITSNSSANADEGAEYDSEMQDSIDTMNKVKEETEESEDDSKKDDGVTVDYYGDQILSNPPKTKKEALAALKKFPKVAKNSSKVIYYTMAPISRYCDSDLAVVVRDLNEKQTESLTEKPDEMEESKLDIKELLEKSTSGKFSRTIGKTISDYLHKFNNYQTSWMQNATLLIKKFRARKLGVSAIMDHVANYENSPFSPLAVDRFLKNRQREIETVESMIDEEKNGIIIYEEDSGLDNNCMFKKRLTAQYLLEILPNQGHADDFVNHFNKCNTSETTCLDKYDEMVGKYWFWDDSLIAMAGTKLRGFLQLFNTTENKQDTCFIIHILKRGKKSKNAKIVLHKDGEKVTDDLQPPKKVVNFHNFTVTMNNINFTIKHSKSSNVTDTLRIEYGEVTEEEESYDSMKIVKHFDLPNNNTDKFIILDDLKSNKTYKIKIWAGSEFGYGPCSDEIFVVTNAFSSPRNFHVENHTDTYLNLKWEMPKYPKVAKVKEYQIMVYAGKKHDRYNFPMVILVFFT